MTNTNSELETLLSESKITKSELQALQNISRTKSAAKKPRTSFRPGPQEPAGGPHRGEFQYSIDLKEYYIRLPKLQQLKAGDIVSTWEPDPAHVGVVMYMNQFIAHAYIKWFNSKIIFTQAMPAWLLSKLD